MNELANGRAEPERLLWCDLARAIAAALVVLIHVAAKWFESYGRISVFDWQVANILDSAARLSVPWFFMLSGFLLFRRKPEPFTIYIRRRFARVLGPFLVFSLLGIVAASTIGPEPASWNVLINPTYYHLWFFYPLLIFYFLAYFITPVSANPWLALAVCYVLIAIAGGGLEILGIGGLGVGSERNFAYVLYGLAGHYAGRVRADRRTGRICLLVLICAVAALALVTSNLSQASGFGNEAHYAYVSIPVATASIAGFVWIRTLGLHLESVVPPAANSIIVWISSYSLAIYGLHAFILAIVWNTAGRTFLELGALPGIWLLVIGTGVLSLATAWVIATIDQRGVLLGTPSKGANSIL
ncbi:MAG: acyltransferase family protein [Rhodospirillales bacterium]|nr:acyltransferase family protein [Rhodospirillales bacterium]